MADRRRYRYRALSRLGAKVDQTYIETNGIRLHVLQDGPEDGPLVLLLHGFPEFSHSWLEQIRHLAAAGYRVWAPDQRGYNSSDKPERIASYGLEELVADVVGLIDAADEESAFVVAHDWGAAVAWLLASRHPDRVSKMVVMNVPHPKVMIRHMRTLTQLKKSWYMLLFQIPWLPERLLQARDWAGASQALTATSRRGTFSESDLAAYRQAWAQPNAMRSMINWYRAIVRRPPRLAGDPRITVPTLLIWGARDTALGQEMAQPSIDLCDDGRLVLFENATHWVHHEEPDAVNHLITDFFA